jgi:hypothetical protein
VGVELTLRARLQLRARRSPKRKSRRGAEFEANDRDPRGRPLIRRRVSSRAYRSMRCVSVDRGADGMSQAGRTRRTLSFDRVGSLVRRSLASRGPFNQSGWGRTPAWLSRMSCSTSAARGTTLQMHGSGSTRRASARLRHTSAAPTTSTNMPRCWIASGLTDARARSGVTPKRSARQPRPPAATRGTSRPPVCGGVGRRPSRGHTRRLEKIGVYAAHDHLAAHHAHALDVEVGQGLRNPLRRRLVGLPPRARAAGEWRADRTAAAQRLKSCMGVTKSVSSACPGRRSPQRSLNSSVASAPVGYLRLRTASFCPSPARLRASCSTPARGACLGRRATGRSALRRYRFRVVGVLAARRAGRQRFER